MGKQVRDEPAIFDGPSVVKGRCVFVTGAHGLLGLWLTKALLERQATVIALQRDIRVSGISLEGIGDSLVTVQGDIRDGELLQRVLVQYEVDTVFHLAAWAVVGMAGQLPTQTFDINVRGTWTVLEAARLHGVKRVVIASSDKAYGPQDDLPYSEEASLKPTFPYDASKAAAELLARSYWHTFALPVAITRCANLYGGGDLNRSRLIPEAIDAVLARRQPIIRSDGTPQRDFLHAADAAEAYLRICEGLDRGWARGEAFNVGSGVPRSVAEVVGLIGSLGDSELEPRIIGDGVPHGEIDRQFLSSDKLARLCDWRPRIALEEGLTQTIEWYRRHHAALGWNESASEGLAITK